MEVWLDERTQQQARILCDIEFPGGAPKMHGGMANVVSAAFYCLQVQVGQFGFTWGCFEEQKRHWWANAP